ncbi:retrovirus-related Pol polyprotein from type-1 retrotransposable element R2, partial [Nephila pilipes]
MDSPPTGPPPISPFKKALYSRVVKKGLFHCQFCEKAYVSEEKAIRHKKDIHGISPHKTVAKFFPDCPPEMCRVCCKGPAPYSTIADHYKYVHNLSISTSTSPGTISSIVVPSSDFVSTSNKHIRNFTSNLPKSENKKSYQNSTAMKNTSANNNLKTKIYNNLKIVARPELRGTGPSKIVSVPYAATNKKSSPSPTVLPKITIQAEIHHRNSSQVPHSNSPRKCSLCPFIAIKQIGLRLHYFKNHGLRKIPTCSTNPQKILQSNQNKKTNSPLPGSIAQASISIPAISKINPPTTCKNQKKNSSNSKKLSTIPPEISTQIYTATPIPTGDQDINVITAQLKIVLPSKNAVTSQLPVVTPQPPSPIVPFVSFNSLTLQYSFPIPTRLQCPIEGCNASFGTKSCCKIESENQHAIEIENITKIDLDNVSILASFAEPLDAILEVDDIEEAQVAFESLLDDIISIMQNHFHLAPSNESRKAPPSISSTRVKSDPQNAQLIQRQYRWNRRKCVRNIVNPSSSFCQIEKNLLHSHFTESWAPPSVQHTFPECSPPTLPPVLELLHADAIASCLQSCENSAPGPDRLSYQHWKSIDPRCIIISKIFNICIKFKDVPSSWKHSTCILIPKKGDVSSILNWRPITLSNSIYKLFSKCLARRLQDWCGMHNIISPCQKGFTPFHGVVEHNFVIGQHLEAARRSHTESFLVWLDISNAFGSIPHNILFSAMSSVGIDQDFIHLIQKLYSNSSTKIITNQG